MTANLTPDALRKSALDIIEDCRNNLKDGKVDISRVETSVRAYCEAITALPVEEGKTHSESLQELMQLVTKLGEELAQERELVKKQLSSLENVRKAHTAYKNTEGISNKKGSASDGK